MLKRIGVNIENLNPEIKSKFDIIDMVFDIVVGEEAVIISGNDGKHDISSEHYSNEAIDLDVSKFNDKKKLEIVSMLKDNLDHRFIVRLWPDHICLIFSDLI